MVCYTFFGKFRHYLREALKVKCGLPVFAALFAAGIYLYDKLSVDFTLLFFISFIFISVIIPLIFRRKRTVNFTMVFCVGAFIAGILVCNYSHGRLFAYDVYVDQYVTVTGRVAELPDVSGDNMRYIVDVRDISMNGKSENADMRIAVTSPEIVPFGETASFTGFIKEFPPKLNESGFDLVKYYQSKGVAFKMYSEEVSAGGEKIRDISFYALSNRLKYIISQLIEKYNTGDKAAVLKAVLTGNKNEFSEEFDDLLLKTGTKRFFYPAFLHILLLSSLVGMFTRILKRRARDILLAVLVVLYALMNTSDAGSLRSGLTTAALLAMGIWLGYTRKEDALSAAVIIIGIFNPLMFFNAGFILSVVSGILSVCFYSPVYNGLKKIRRRYLRGSVTAGIIGTVGLIPVTAYFFNGVNIYSIFVSVVFIPAVAGILIAFPIAAVMYAVFGAAPAVSGFITALVYVLMKIPYVINLLPFSRIIIARPGIMAMAAWFFALGAVYMKIREKPVKMKVLICAALSCALSVTFNQLSRLGTVEMTFVNVGQGDGAVIRAPFKETIIIDGGGGQIYSDYDPGKKVFLPYLESEGISEIEAAFVSHYHKDHVQGVIAAIENLHVKNVFMPSSLPANEWRAALERAANENGTKIHYVNENCDVVFDNGLRVEITVPDRQTLLSTDENDTTLLMNVSYGEFNCLFTGDMTSFEEGMMLYRGAVPEAEVLKVAHHGSAYSTRGEWVEAVKPDYAVISVGENNGYGHPAEETLERLKDAEILRTDELGDITIIGDKSGVKRVDAFRD